MRGLLAALALAVFMAMPASAGAWTAPRTVGTMKYGGETRLAFNARGDAILTAHGETRGFTSIRPAGGRFGPPRPYRTSYAFNAPQAVLDMDRSALLLGDWYHRAPELEDPESRDECCYRVYAKRLARSGRSGRTQLLTPYGVDSGLVRVETDERGRAGLVFAQAEALLGALRQPGAAVGRPYPIERPPRGLFEQVAVRPDGRGLAAWGSYDDEHVGYAPIGRDGSLGEQRSVFRSDGPGYAVLRDLLIGRGGQAWLLWGVTEPGDRETWYLAQRHRDGSFGGVRRVGGGTGVPFGAVDDAGNLTVAWRDNKGLVARFASRGGSLGPTRRLVRNGRHEDVAVAAGPRGRTVVVWQTVTGRDSRAYFTALNAMAGWNGRFGPVRTIARGARNETIGYAALGVTPRGAAIAAWNQTPAEGRARIRYSVLAP